MERMLRMNKDNSDYEIDRELTGKLAIESNAELQDKVEELEEENKKLKLENADLMGERDGLKMVVERLQKEVAELEKPHPKFSDFGGYDE